VHFQPIAVREITVAPEIDCRKRRPDEVVARVEQVLTKLEPAAGHIVILKLRDIDPATWSEVQRERRRIEHALLPECFELRWERTFAKSIRGQGSAGPGIGSLQAEFAAFLRTATIEGLDRERLRRLGEHFLSEALDRETAE
jgi:hypothetical protein